MVMERGKNIEAAKQQSGPAMNTPAGADVARQKMKRRGKESNG